MRAVLVTLLLAGCVPAGSGTKPEGAPDADGDGTPDDEDCAPDDAAVHPGTAEACNGIDDDCDAAIDEEVTTTWYVDADADGYAGTATEACEAPAGGEAVASDCDDTTADVSPGATETCGNERDDDCDGAELRCPIEGDVPVGTAPTAFYGSDTQAVGYTVARAGDVDGDGRGDLWIGAWGDGAADWAGGVYLVPGSASGPQPIEEVALAHLYGTRTRQRVGAAIAGGDDLDGDGVADAAISGDGDANDMGRAYLLLGGIAGEAALTAAWPDIVTTGLVEAERMGAALATSPDLTGDGVGDLVVGSNGTGAEVGAWVLAGPFGGERPIDEAVVIGAGATTAYPGRSVAGVGDLDGDGLSDLVVGAYGWSSGKGAALVVHGPVVEDVAITDVDRLVEGEHEDDMLGQAAVGGRGDVDGDGLDDFLAGAPWCEINGAMAGAAYLVRGSATAAGTELARDAAAVFHGLHAYGYVGSDLDLADLDGDGRADVVFRVQRGTAGDEGPGAVHVFYGPVSGLLNPDDADARFVGEADGDELGTGIANVGDTNLDGLDDLLLGASENGTYGAGGGAAYLFR